MYFLSLIVLLFSIKFCRLCSENALERLTGKSTEKVPYGRPRCRWEDNIRMGLKEIGTNTRKWDDSAQVRDYWRALVNATLNLRVP